MQLEVGAKLTRETLVDRLGAQLRQLIVTEQVKPGDTFPSERSLCEAFGVGRTTVREALQGMVATGLLERRNKELVVADPASIPTQEMDMAALAARMSVKDVFEVRELLESPIVEGAARNARSADLDRLRVALDAMRDAATDVEYHEAHAEFHRQIARAGRNPVLASVYEDNFHLFFRLPAYWRLFGHELDQAKGRINGYRGHASLYEAIESHDPDGAVRLNNEMNERIKRNIIRKLNKSGA